MSSIIFNLPGGRCRNAAIGCRALTCGRGCSRLPGVLLQEVRSKRGLDVGVEDASQALLINFMLCQLKVLSLLVNLIRHLVVCRLDVPLVVGRLAEDLRAVLLGAALPLPLLQVLPEQLPRLGLVLAVRAGGGPGGRLGGSLFLEAAGADLEVLLEQGRRHHLHLAVGAPPGGWLLGGRGGNHG